MNEIDIQKLKARLATLERSLAEQANQVKSLESRVCSLTESRRWAYEAIQDLRNHAERTSK